MKVFGAYSTYYDLLYKDKDYKSEADFVNKLIHEYLPGSKSILDLGCGTGKHDIELAAKGYNVTGIDKSVEMLTIAKKNINQLEEEIANRLSYIDGDVRSIRLNKYYDVVISLFHVFSYQQTNLDIKKFLRTVKTHLSDPGLLIFDFWYGPAVLTQMPSNRTKFFDDNSTHIERIAEPKIYPNDNIVDVQYKIAVQSKIDNLINEFSETHRMRYLFGPEVKYFLNEIGFCLINWGEWLTGIEPGFDTWSVYAVCAPRKAGGYS